MRIDNLLKMVLKLSKLCRLCLLEGDKLSAIFTNDQSKTADKIMACVPIEVSENDELPQQICNRCLQQINRWFKFRGVCMNADKHLRSYMNKTNFNEIKAEEENGILQIHDSGQEYSDTSERNDQPSDRDDVESIPETVPLANKVTSEFNDESIACCKGKQTCVVFHSESKKLVQETTPQPKSSITETYKCPLCHNTYILDKNLSFHICSSCTSKLYICNLCGQNFSTFKAMRCHASSHFGKFPCETCGYYFSAELHLEVHRRKHTGHKPHACPHCDKSFMYGSSLQFHLSGHSGQNSFVCDVCGRRSFSKGNYERHKATHTKVKSFMCEICGKAFVVNGDLKRHRLSHSSEKLFTCNICEKKFKTSGILMNHKKIHKEERPFSCKLCGKSFVRHDGLKEHSLTHTGEKRHKCLVCGKQFTWSKGLRKHKCDPSHI